MSAEVTRIGAETRRHLEAEWDGFCRRRQAILARAQTGGPPKERDVEDIFQALAEGPLGYQLKQLSPQRSYADYVLLDRGLKLVAVELKAFGQFRNGTSQAPLAAALEQAAHYAGQQRIPNVMAFDGELLAFGKVDAGKAKIAVHLQCSVDCDTPPSDLFFLTHYGIFRQPTTVLYSVPFEPEKDESLYKQHHGEMLHYSCFAYVGDLRNKATWAMPYRNADGTVDTGRLGHATNYMFSPGGYRGQKASDMKIPEAATTLVALRLARAYKEIGKWQRPARLFELGDKPAPQEILWLYLYQQGLDDLL